MGLDVKNMGIIIGKGLIFSVKTCFRSVRDHPFYWGLVFFLISLYRFFPSLSGLLIASSPVLVCTAALLGILLSSGNPIIPEIDKDEQKTREVASLKAAVVENDVVLQRDESLSAEAHVEKRGEVEERVAEEPTSLNLGIEANTTKVDKEMASSTIEDNSLMERTREIEEVPKEIPIPIPGEEQLIKEEREFNAAELIEKREFDEEDLLIGGAPGARKDIDGISSIVQEEHETPRRKIDMPAGAFSIAQDLSWERVKSHESGDSDSDRAESSSPDASMAEIMPMLYELHPLLESEPSEAPYVSLLNPAAVLEIVNRTHDGSAGSEEEGEIQEEEEDEDDDDDEEEEEEEEAVQGTQGNGTKDVVTWTEDDQKNLMDLGTLELERNQRLESLIAKRRARKLMGMEAEKNLIDLDGNDPPFQIPPISTRRNPFDLPYDSHEDLGLPPIPGSAPSVMIPRRNPFDIPYEPYEEKPNLTENSSQQEFMPFQPKDFQFRRHESFSLGDPVEPKQRRFTPFFVTERMASEGVEYPIFQRQFIEKSNSKVSSVPETEAVSSAADQEDYNRLADQELTQEGNPISYTDEASLHVECGSQSSDVDLVEIDPEQKKAVKVDEIDVKRVNEEQRVMHVDSTTNSVESDSQASGELDSAEVYPERKRDFDVGVDMNAIDEEAVHEVELHPNHSGNVALLEEADESEVHAVQEKYTDSTSSLSEVHEKLFHMESSEGSRDRELKRDDNSDGSSVSVRSSLTESDFNLRNRIMEVGNEEVGNENQEKEPLYDSCPSEIEKTLSNMSTIQEALLYVDKGVVASTPSVTSDFQVEVPEVDPTPVVVHREDGESVSHDGSKIEISPCSESLWMASSNLCAVDEIESSSMPVTEISDQDVIKAGFSGVSLNADDSYVPKAIVGDPSCGPGSSSFETKLGYRVSLPSSDEDLQQLDANLKVNSLDFYHSEADLRSASELETPIPLTEESSVHSYHEETQDSSASSEESNVLAPEEEDSSNLSTLTAAVPVPPEVFEIKSTPPPTDIKEDVLVSIQNREESPMFENQHDSVEAIGPFITKEEFSEEVEGIKEIDESILSELDTVGDFSVKELVVSTDQKEDELSLEERESLAEQVLGERPIEDIELDSDKPSSLETVAESPNENESGSANFGVEVIVPEVTESTSDSQILGTGSPDDVNVDIKHIPEGVVEKSVVVESIQSEPSPKETEGEFPELELTKHDPSQQNVGSELPVIEARSLEDIEPVFKELNQGVLETIVTESFDDKPAMVETEIGPSEGVLDLAATTSMLPVLEASLVEDIDMPSDQIHGVQSTIITESFHDKLTGETSEVQLAGAQPAGDLCTTAADSELPVLEARSLEDIDLALKQIQEGVQKPVTTESFHDELMGEKNEVGLPSSELPVLEAKSIEDIELAFKQLKDGDLEGSVLPKSVDSPPLVESQDVVETHPHVPVDDVKSSEGLQVESEEMRKVGAIESGQSDETTEISSGIPVLEAKTIEDIDLAFKQLQGDLEVTVLPKSVDGTPLVESKDMVETHPHLPVDDAKSLEGLEVEAKEKEEAGVSESQRSDEATEISSELPVLEAKFSEDIDLAFKQLQGGDLEGTVLPKSVDVTPLVEAKDVVETYPHLPVDDAKSLEALEVEAKEEEKVGVSESGRSDVATGISSELPVLEAKSVEDIDFAFKQLQGGDLEVTALTKSVDRLPVVESQDVEDTHSHLLADDSKSSEGLETEVKEMEKVGVSESGRSDEATESSELPVLEVKSIEDIDLAFSQLQGLDLEGTALPKLVDGPTVVESQDVEETHANLPADDSKSSEVLEAEVTEMEKVGVGEAGLSDEATEISSELPVLEAKSIQDINLAFKQLQGGDVEGSFLPKSVDRPAVVESQDVVDTHSHLPVDAKSSEGVEVKELEKI